MQLYSLCVTYLSHSSALPSSLAALPVQPPSTDWGWGRLKAGCLLSVSLLFPLFLLSARVVHSQRQRLTAPCNLDDPLHYTYKDIVIRVDIITPFGVCEQFSWCQNCHCLDGKDRLCELCNPGVYFWTLWAGREAGLWTRTFFFPFWWSNTQLAPICSQLLNSCPLDYLCSLEISIGSTDTFCHLLIAVLFHSSPFQVLY